MTLYKPRILLEGYKTIVQNESQDQKARGDLEALGPKKTPNKQRNKETNKKKKRKEKIKGEKMPIPVVPSPIIR